MSDYIFEDKIQFREWDEYDLHKDACIDKYDLDVQAEDHPHVVEKWLELLTQAQAQLKKAKEVLENKEAQLFLKAKTGEISSLGSKPTDSLVKAWVKTQPECRKLQRRKRKAENSVGYLQNARSVLEHRKAMIKEINAMWITGYFAKPHVSKEIKEKLDEGRRKQHAQQLEKSLVKRHLRQGDDNGKATKYA